ncbi:MAG: flagellar biosynthetic protein FliO [Synergistaceae bacterium]|jgi:flagellar biogenesis protein FliO|nr:flagellar biosynthetic protein FliO [Synergistaceae bacterium]
MRKRALRLIGMAALALFFCICAECPIYAASQASEDVVPQIQSLDSSLTGYIGRMLLALALFGAVGYGAAKFLPRFFKSGGAGRMRVIGALSLGRDAVYILQVGPDVVALFVGKGGSVLLGKWSLDEWEDYDASLSPGAHEGQRTKDSGEFL